MKKRIENRISAAGATVVFMGLIRTELRPSLFVLSALTIGFYECIYAIIRIARKQRKRCHAEAVGKIQQLNGRRWAEEWFNPYREVSA